MIGRLTPSLALLAVLCGCASEPADHAVTPPAGFISFCAEHLEDCAYKTTSAVPLIMTTDRYDALTAINHAVNRSILPRLPVMNGAEHWDYAKDGIGDCVQFALAKRRALIGAGFDRSDVLLALASISERENHLVVIVRTQSGDLVLDNRSDVIVAPSRLPYRWIAIQSQRDPAIWHSFTQ